MTILIYKTKKIETKNFVSNKKSLRSIKNFLKKKVFINKTNKNFKQNIKLK